MEDPHNGSASSAGSADQRPPRTPMWVKVFAGIGLLLLAIAVAALILGGQHGPDRHASAKVRTEETTAVGASAARSDQTARSAFAAIGTRAFVSRTRSAEVFRRADIVS